MVLGVKMERERAKAKATDISANIFDPLPESVPSARSAICIAERTRMRL